MGAPFEQNVVTRISALVGPDVELLQSRRFTGRMDGPLHVVQVERIEWALPGLQVKVAKATERASEFASACVRASGMHAARGEAGRAMRNPSSHRLGGLDRIVGLTPSKPISRQVFFWGDYWLAASPVRPRTFLVTNI